VAAGIPSARAHGEEDHDEGEYRKVPIHKSKPSA
jgi:hypothetical protein